MYFFFVYLFICLFIYSFIYLFIYVLRAEEELGRNLLLGRLSSSSLISIISQACCLVMFSLPIVYEPHKNRQEISHVYSAPNCLWECGDITQNPPLPVHWNCQLHVCTGNYTLAIIIEGKNNGLTSNSHHPFFEIIQLSFFLSFSLFHSEQWAFMLSLHGVQESLWGGEAGRDGKEGCWVCEIWNYASLHHTMIRKLT